MAKIVPEYSLRQIDRFGRLFADNWRADAIVFDGYEDALELLLDWRAAHAYPLNKMRVGLGKAARKVDSKSVIVHRLKRFPSIVAKLSRFSTTRLSQMNDIGGCRAIVENIDVVHELVASIENYPWKHEIIDIDNYIMRPQKSGYRGIHLIYRFKSHGRHNGLRIEMQIRSHLQHVWATAVETVEAFTNEALKSGGGRKEWKRFFAMMGTIFALREACPVVRGTLVSYEAFYSELWQLAEDLDVLGRMHAFQHALKMTKSGSLVASPFFLIYSRTTVTPDRIWSSRTEVAGYTENQYQLALKEYARIEQAGKGDPLSNVVLVHADSLAAVRTAYPNYFADTEEFRRLLVKELYGPAVED
jgi:hypothetical protein